MALWHDTPAYPLSEFRASNAVCLGDNIILQSCPLNTRLLAVDDNAYIMARSTRSKVWNYLKMNVYDFTSLYSQLPYLTLSQIKLITRVH